MFLFKRKSIYYIQYYDDKSETIKRKSTGKSKKSEALKFLSEFKILLLEHNAMQKILLSDFEKEYLDYVKQTKSKKYVDSIKLSFKKLNNLIKDKFISSISTRETEKFLLSTFNNSVSSAHLYHKTLKAAFNKAIHWGYLDVNVFSKLVLPKKDKKIPTFIDERELAKIIQNTGNQVLQRIFVIAFYTGMRLNEITNLRWESIDLNLNRITLKISENFCTKNKKERVIPISDLILEEFHILKKENRSEFVFPNTNGYKYNNDYVTHYFKNAVRSANLSDEIHFHTLRHSFASNLVQKGISIYIVKELLGHESISTTQIYSHLSNATLVEAIQKM